MLRILVFVLAIAAILAGSLAASAATWSPIGLGHDPSAALSADDGTDGACLCDLFGTCSPSVAAEPASSGIGYDRGLSNLKVFDDAHRAGVVPEVPRPPPRQT